MAVFSEVEESPAGQNFFWSLCYLFSSVMHMSKFLKIAWGKCYNQVFIHCRHIKMYSKFILVWRAENLSRVSYTQGVYNRLLLVPIVGGACFLRHQLAAVFNASFGVYRMTCEISRIHRKGEEGDFCDVLPTYPWNVTKMAVLLRTKLKSLG